MTTSSLPAALRAAAEGICTLEAATGLVIASGSWLGRDDFARFIHHGAGTAAISLGEAVTGIDDRNFALLIKSVWHASGRCQFG